MDLKRAWNLYSTSLSESIEDNGDKMGDIEDDMMVDSGLMPDFVLEFGNKLHQMFGNDCFVFQELKDCFEKFGIPGMRMAVNWVNNNENVFRTRIGNSGVNPLVLLNVLECCGEEDGSCRFPNVSQLYQTLCDAYSDKSDIDFDSYDLTEWVKRHSDYEECDRFIEYINNNTEEFYIIMEVLRGDPLDFCCDDDGNLTDDEYEGQAMYQLWSKKDADRYVEQEGASDMEGCWTNKDLWEWCLDSRSSLDIQEIFPYPYSKDAAVYDWRECHDGDTDIIKHYYKKNYEIDINEIELDTDEKDDILSEYCDDNDCDIDSLTDEKKEEIITEWKNGNFDEDDIVDWIEEHDQLPSIYDLELTSEDEDDIFEQEQEYYWEYYNGQEPDWDEYARQVYETDGFNRFRSSYDGEDYTGVVDGKEYIVILENT